MVNVAEPFIDKNTFGAQALRDARRFGGETKLAKLLRVMAAADNGQNPWQRPVMSAPPTVTALATSDNSLAPRIDMVSGGNVLTTNGVGRFNWYGGVPTIKSGSYVAMPVASVLPATNGNAGLGNDLNQWASACETVTDATSIEFWIYAHSGRKVMFQCDGFYVDKAGTPGAQASNLDNMFKLVFPTATHRRIRVLLPNAPSIGPCYMKAVRVNTLASFWKPPLEDVVRVGWWGDSYSEGTNGASSVYPIPNAAWPVITCELLGFRDCRQLAVGSTGYISSNGGVFSKLRDQMPRWTSQGPFDLIVFAGGYNDASNTAADITAEVLFDLQQCRTLHPNTPIVVHGSQCGAGGPNATQIACDNAIGAAVVAFNDPLCKFIPVSTDNPTWLNGTGKIGTTNGSGNSDIYVDPDGIHPSLAGQEFLAFRSAGGIRKALQLMAA